MGADIAASPHFPWVDAKAGEGQALFPWRIGIRPWLCSQVVFLSGRRPVTLLPRIGPQFRCSSKHCCFASFPRSSRNIAIPRTPARLASEYRYSADDPFAPPLPEDFSFAGLPSESGVGSSLRLCLTLLPRITLPSLRQRSILRSFAAFRGGLGLSLLFVSEDPLPTADHPYDPAFRVAPSGIFGVSLWITGIT